MPENIHPIFNDMLDRSDKERLLKQHAKVLWLTGLSGSGKSTIARSLEESLFQRGYLTKLLDGDNIRTGLNNNLEFSSEDRTENIRRIAEVSKLFTENGIITINAFVSPEKKMRDMARNIIGERGFIEIYINCPLEICEERDEKGLYKKARAGKLKGFTGIDAPFERPQNPDLEILTHKVTVKIAVEMILEYLIPLIEYKK